MSIVRSDEYRAAGAEAAKILLKEQSLLSAEAKVGLEIQVRRSRVLRQIEAITGLRFDVDRKAPKGVAGYMLVANKKVFITEESLDNPEWAKYVARHEAMHVHTGDCHLDFEENLSKEQFEMLEHELAKEEIPIKEINWVEGFNDLKTIEKHGAHDNSGYLKKEVPAAEKLDDLCIKATGKSLLSAFGNRDRFLSRLRELTDVLILQNAIEKAKVFDNEGKEVSSIMVAQLKRKMKERLSTREGYGEEDLEKVARKTFFEIAEIIGLREALELEGHLKLEEQSGQNSEWSFAA